jgi:hypothetical protein
MHFAVNARAAQGNTTDVAVLRFASATDGDDPIASRPRAFEISFNSKNKWVLTLFHSPVKRMRRGMVNIMSTSKMPLMSFRIAQLTGQADQTRFRPWIPRHGLT